MEKNQLDWGDLLYLYTLANSDSLMDAAEKLEVNRTTVSRKIENLEDALGAKLFIKSGRELVLTDFGQKALQSAEMVKDQVGSLQRHARDDGQELAGLVRITATPKLCALIEPELSAFLAENPDVIIELSASMAAEDLEKLESDIALRLTKSPPEALIGTKLADPASALYASRDYSREILPTNRSASNLRFIDSVGALAAKGWLETELNYTPNIVMRCNSTDLVVHYVRSGVGAAYLPCYVGELDPELVRVSEVRRSKVADLWLLYPEQYRDTVRIKAVVEVLKKSIQRLKPMIEGQQLL